MAEGGATERRLGFGQFVHVVEALSIRGKSKPPQIAARQNVRQRSAQLEIEHRERAGSLAAFFGFIEQKPSVGGGLERFHCCMNSLPERGRIDEQLVASVRP